MEFAFFRKWPVVGTVLKKNCTYFEVAILLVLLLLQFFSPVLHWTSEKHWTGEIRLDKRREEHYSDHNLSVRGK